MRCPLARPVPAVVAEGVSFTYARSPSPALDGVGFEVREGEVFGVLGPNGAGKTTLMKLLATVLVPAAGRLEVLGHALPGGEAGVRGRLGVAFAEYERAFSFRLTGRQNLAYFSAFVGIPRREQRARVDAALQTVGLLDKADGLFMTYSTGMKHRLALARALLPQPELLVLDEPTAGLDQQTARELGATLRGLAAKGTSILYTTHRLEEAGALCDRVLVLAKGRVAALASPRDLARLAEEVSAIEVETDAVLPADLSDVRALPGVVTVTALGRARLRAQTTDVDATTEALVGWVRRRGLKVVAITSSSATLSDAFVAITEGRIRGKAA